MDEQERTDQVKLAAAGDRDALQRLIIHYHAALHGTVEAALAASDSTPSRQVAKAEATAAVMSSLARLTDDQRNVVRLCYLEGRPVSGVAAVLGKSEPAIHMLCHRALKELRRLMLSITRYLTLG